MDKYSIDYSANSIVNTITAGNIGIALGSGTTTPGIIVSPDAVFIKPLKLVVLTEDVYNRLKGEENDR